MVVVNKVEDNVVLYYNTEATGRSIYWSYMPFIRIEFHIKGFLRPRKGTTDDIILHIESIKPSIELPEYKAGHLTQITKGIKFFIKEKYNLDSFIPKKVLSFGSKLISNLDILITPTTAPEEEVCKKCNGLLILREDVHGAYLSCYNCGSHYYS